MASTNTIPTGKILERLRFENPWWKTKAIDPVISKMNRRLYFDSFFPLIENVSIKRAVILMGPRRVGKTVMMFQAIQTLLNKGIPPQRIGFIGIDNPIYAGKSLEDLMMLVVETTGEEFKEGAFIFFDEIQYMKDWERHLKILVDSYPKIKFVVSGSSAAALRLKSSESGAGRFHDFILPPLTFQEFLHLQDLEHLINREITPQSINTYFYTALDIKELNIQFFNYLNYGGYPEVIFNDTIRNNMASFVKSDIIDKVLLRDLPNLYGINDVQELNRFFTYLAYNTGKDFSPQKISKNSGLNNSTVKRYLEYLQAAFLINVVHKIDENSRQFKRVTGFKIYLTNPSLRTALFAPVSPTDDEAGNIVETAIFTQIMHQAYDQVYYAKWKMGRKEGEVDMVILDNMKLKPQSALEIKWSNRYVQKPAELKSLLTFCESNGLKQATVTTIDKQDQQRIDNLKLNFYPAAIYAYMMGAQTLK